MLCEYMDYFQLLRFSAGFNSRKSVAEYLHVNTTTVDRWENGETTIPFAVLELLNILTGAVPESGRNRPFDGWRFVSNNEENYLYSPNGDKYTAGDVASIKITKSRVRFQEVEIAQLQAEIKRLTPETKALPDNVLRFPTFARS